MQAPGSTVPGSTVTVTGRLLASAPSRGQRTALTGGLAGPVCYAELAATVQAAAAGLAWRGLQPGDAVGVHVPDAACYVVAAHAIRAAGGVPSPVAPGLTVEEIAGQLGDCSARLLLTGPPLEWAAQAAAELSLVRQVISFGDAPGTVQFSAMLHMGTLQAQHGRPADIALLPYERRGNGTLGRAPVSHRDLLSLLSKLSSEVRIGEADVVLAGPPAGDALSYTALIDLALLRGATVASAGADELTPAELATIGEEHQATTVITAGDAEAAIRRLRMLPEVS
jgi:non-ribosomal peptide synthetase component F